MIFDAVHNYYAQMVCDKIRKTLSRTTAPKTPIFSKTSLVLHSIGYRHAITRHRIDLGFYITSHERERMEFSVRDAVFHAVEYVMRRLRQDEDRKGKQRDDRRVRLSDGLDATTLNSVNRST